MFITRHLTTCLVALFGLASQLSGQYLFSYPGPDDPASTDVYVIDLATLQQAAMINAPGTFEVLSTTTGSQHFFISNGIQQQGAPTLPAPIIVTNQFFQTRETKSFGTFTQPLTSGFLSPNETYLVVGESTLHIFLASSEKEQTPSGGLPIDDATTVVDVAVGYDSLNAYALATTATGSYLVDIDLNPEDRNTTLFAVTKSLAITGLATTLTIGPNGLLYVTLPNQMLEINPSTFTTTPNGTIAVNGNPGRPVFTPDGNYAVIADQSPVAGGEAAALIDLNTDTETSSIPYDGLPSPITQLAVASSQTVYAFCQGLTTLYALQIGGNGGIILTVPTLPTSLGGVTFNNSSISAFGVTPDLGAPGRNFPQYILVLDTTGYLFAIDPVSLVAIGDTNQQIVNFGGGVSYFIPTFNANPDIETVLIYGNNQTVPLGGTSLPLVVRALDQNGYPVGGLGGPTESFTLVGGGADETIEPANPVTGSNGYAEALFVAGTQAADVGTETVQTSLGLSPPSFSITVGTPVPASAASLSIVSGQGQLLFVDPLYAPANPNTFPPTPAVGTPPDAVSPLTVVALDSNGDPLNGVTVTFTLDPTIPGAAMIVAVTGPVPSNETILPGQASVTFPTPPVDTGYPGYATYTVAATTGSLTQTFDITVVPKTSIVPPMCATPPCLPAVPSPFLLQEITPASGTVLSGTAGSTLTGAMQISVSSVQFAVPIPNVGVAVNTGTNLNATNASCANPDGSGLAITNAQGIATCSLVLNDVAGTMPLIVTVPAEPGSNTPISPFTGFVTLTITPNQASAVAIVSGNNQAGFVGTQLPMPLALGVTDSNNAPVGGAAVTWVVTSGPFTLGTVSATTDNNGQATATGMFSSTAGPIVVTATVDSVPAIFNLTSGIVPDTLAIVSGNDQSTQSVTAFANPLVVSLTSNGNPASYAPVTWTSSSPTDGVVLPATLPSSADVNGQASISVTAGPGNGSFSVTATSNQITASFSLTVLPPGPTNVQILNSATYTPYIAPGTLVSLFGSTLTPTITGTDTDPLDLDNWIITFGGNPAPVQALINENGTQQINVVVPFELSPGSNFVSIQTPQGSAQINNVNVTTLAPGIFTNGTVAVNGTDYPLAVVVRQDGSYVSASNPVQPGDTITFYATGLGQTTPTSAITAFPGEPGQDVAAPLYVGINNQSVAVSSAVYSVGAFGLYQITVQVPTTVAPGPGQLLSLYVIDESTSPGTGYNAPNVYIPIQ